MGLKFALCALAWSGLAALVWFFGPIVSVGEVQPLGKAWSRAAVITVLGVFILGPLARRAWLLRKAEQALKIGLTQQDENARLQSDKLQGLFHTAVNTLKKHQVRKAWYVSKPGLYQLPWYIIIGPPGSGKTTVLKNAGLRFPLQDLHGHNSIKGVGGTRNCDWWFTDQAVLIDTAGRFTTQDSDPHTDAAGWNAFLNLLKKYRPRQPVNGVLLTLSTQDLLGPEMEREKIASRLSQRLQEMIRILGVCPPVYVLVTKLDLLEGFQDTFGRLGEQERSLAWGVNFQHPNELNTSLGTTLPDALQDMVYHLSSQMNHHLQLEHQEHRRVRLFEFPLAFGRLKPVLEKTLHQALQADSLFEQPVALRGVYFSSGTQDTNLFDRIASASSQEQPAASTSSGKGFFIRDLLLRVVFAEQHLAGQVKKTVLLQQAAYWGGLAASLGCFLMLMVGWWASWTNNTEAVAATLERSGEWSADVHTLNAQSAGSTSELFRALSKMRNLAPESPDSLTHHLGLNQDEKLQQAEEIAYRKALENNLMPLIAKRLEEGLQLAMLRADESVHDALKAYLMLYTPARFDPKALTEWVLADWKTNPLYMAELQDQPEAFQHLEAAFGLGAPAQLEPKNSQLIQQARELLHATPIENRLYQRMVRQFPPELARGIGLADAVGAGASQLFMQPGGKPLVEGDDPFFTREAYLGYFLPQLPLQAARLSEEADWIMGLETVDRETVGRPAGAAHAKADLLVQVREIYLRNYVAHWNTRLDGIRLKPLNNLDQALETTRMLASGQSPLKKLLEAVTRHTTLASTEAKPALLITPLEKQVNEHFSQINALFEGKAPSYPRVAELFNSLYGHLAAVAQARASNSTPPPAAALDSLRASAGLMPEPIRRIASDLAAYGHNQGKAAERAHLTAELLPLAETCKRLVANRYPVQASSGLDILLDDFTRFFGPGGAMDQFYQGHLASRNDNPAGHSQTMRTGHSLRQFQQSARIREAFFQGNSAVPKFEFELRLVNSSQANDVFYLEMDGDLKMFSRQAQTVHRIRWGGQGASALLRVKASDGDYKSFSGPWGLFRWMDTGNIDSSSRPEHVRLHFQVDGKFFEFDVLANSVVNPLRLPELRQFRCPTAL